MDDSSDSKFNSTSRTDPYSMGHSCDAAILQTEPDIITRPPITSQPSVTSLYSLGPWTYTPTGPSPLERHNPLDSELSLFSEVKTRPCSVTKDRISVSTPSAGSRDWSKDLFDSFKTLKESKNRCSGIKIFCSECFQVPCMLCDIARSLGDKVYLPFVPGTGAAIRFKVRILGGIQGSIGDDCLVTTCCCPCAVCQMYREIEDIGLGPVS